MAKESFVLKNVIGHTTQVNVMYNTINKLYLVVFATKHFKFKISG